MELEKTKAEIRIELVHKIQNIDNIIALHGPSIPGTPVTLLPSNKGIIIYPNTDLHKIINIFDTHTSASKVQTSIADLVYNYIGSITQSAMRNNLNAVTVVHNLSGNAILRYHLTIDLAKRLRETNSIIEKLFDMIIGVNELVMYSVDAPAGPTRPHTILEKRRDAMRNAYDYAIFKGV